MSAIKKAAAIGGGVIGAGWVARLLNGIDVSSSMVRPREVSDDEGRTRP